MLVNSGWSTVLYELCTRTELCNVSILNVQLIRALADNVGYHVTRENGPTQNRAVLAGCETMCETILSSTIALFSLNVL